MDFTTSAEAALEAGRQELKGLMEIKLCHIYMSVQCVTIPEWRQRPRSGGGSLSLRSWPAGWAKSDLCSGSPRPGPAPDPGPAGWAVTAAASRRRGKPEEGTSGRLATHLVDFLKKASTRVVSISKEARLGNVYFALQYADGEGQSVKLRIQIADPIIFLHVNWIDEPSMFVAFCNWKADLDIKKHPGLNSDTIQDGMTWHAD